MNRTPFDLAPSRRSLLHGLGGLAATLPFTQVKLAFGGTQPDVHFAYISDSHIQHISGTKFVRNWDRGLIRAVAEANLLNPKPDFVVFGGDLAQLGTKAELDHGADMLSKLNYDVKYVMGEHDYYLDLGEYWSKLFGKQYYSFEHKGIHFVILNSILTDEEWTFRRWPTPEQRMNEMAGLDNPNGSPFEVGDTQRKWLEKDLKKVDKDTPVVVFSHSPLQKIYKGWNFWTEDAEAIQALLKPFKQANVIYGHVHQIQYNRIDNIHFHAVMATAWPWPYPESYAQAESHLPVLTVPMNRADPFQERDATGWQLVDVYTGRPTLSYNLYNNTNRVVGPDPKTGMPRDTAFADRAIAPQKHY
ncbi:MAG: metallophosphoesterase [Deltaproteobacteria bacterium]|nr:metallophosphoesterase [Deltaproteobacteria bacterium]